MELASLIGRLNPDNRRALERAAQRCLQRGHHYVEIEHLLLELLDIEGGDFAYLLPRFGLERDALTAEINKALELFKSGSTRTPALSAQTIGLLEDAVVQASVLGLDSIRSGLLLLALLDRDERRSLLLNSASSLLKNSPGSIAQQSAGVDRKTHANTSAAHDLLMPANRSRNRIRCSISSPKT
ncbi:Clp protease N-terminal domain-containing protein [Pseudomonas lini]